MLRAFYLSIRIKLVKIGRVELPLFITSSLPDFAGCTAPGPF